MLKLITKLLLLLFLVSSCNLDLGTGESTTLKQVANNSKMKKAILLENNGNATVGNSLQVSVVDYNYQVSNKDLGNTLLQVLSECKLWFDDGKNSENKTISNLTIGYGLLTIKYTNGKTREFFQIGMSANKTGISIYILGIKDKTYLARTYGKKLVRRT